MTIVLRDSSGGIRPEFELEVEPVRRQITTPRGAGASFSRQVNDRAVRRWRFSWRNGTEGQRHILEAKWAESKGGTLPMTYLTEDGSETVTGCFVRDSLRLRQTGAATHEMSVEFEEDLTGSTAVGYEGGLNTIVFLVDDVARELMSVYENTSYNPASPGARVDPIPSWLANQWAEVSQDESEFAYPPMPNLRALANNGVLLTRMNTAAMCSPTRASLLTGRNNQQHGLGNALLTPTGTIEQFFVGDTIYKLLRDQGSNYERGHVGKWHITQMMQGYCDGIPPGIDATIACLRKPVEYGGASFFAGNGANQNPWALGLQTGPGDHVDYYWARHDARDNPRPFDGKSSGPYSGQTGLTFDAYFTGTLAGDHNALIQTQDAAIDFIEGAAEDGKPFLLNVWFHAAHCPCVWTDTEDEFGIAYLSTQGFHSYGTTSPNNGYIVAQLKAMMESVDTAIGNIMAAMTPEQASRTMVVYLSDNGTAAEALTVTTGENDILEPTKLCVPGAPENPYSAQHSKRSPWQGGIGAACIINGPAVVDPGDGDVPRIWDGLCGIEDVFGLIATWTGAWLPDDERYETNVLSGCVQNTSATGRDVYIQRAFQNGFADDMFSSSQSGLRFVSGQTSDGWKLLWASVGTGPVGELTEEWQLYKMTDDPTEADDLFAAAKTALGGTPTIQQIYDSMTLAERRHFETIYLAFEAEGLIPPDMEVTV